MEECVVLGCSNNSSNNDIQFFHMPVLSTIQIQWIQACGWKTNTINLDTAKVCSKHFSEESYNTQLKINPDLSTTYQKILKFDAVPTLHLQKKSFIVIPSSAIKPATLKKGKKRKRTKKTHTLDSKEPESQSENEVAAVSNQPENTPIDDKDIDNVEKLDVQISQNDDLPTKIVNLQEQNVTTRNLRSEQSTETKRTNQIQREVTTDSKEPENKSTKGQVTDQPEKTTVEQNKFKPILDIKYSHIDTLEKLDALRAKNDETATKMITLHEKNTIAKNVIDKLKAEHAQYVATEKKYKIDFPVTDYTEQIKKVFSPKQISAIFNQKCVWTNDDMAVAHTLMSLGTRRSYLYLKNTLNIPLPAKSSVQRWLFTNPETMREGVKSHKVKFKKETMKEGVKTHKVKFKKEPGKKLVKVTSKRTTPRPIKPLIKKEDLSL